MYIVIQRYPELFNLPQGAPVKGLPCCCPEIQTKMIIKNSYFRCGSSWLFRTHILFILFICITNFVDFQRLNLYIMIQDCVSYNMYLIYNLECFKLIQMLGNNIIKNILFICRLFKAVKHSTQPCRGTLDPRMPFSIYPSGYIISIKISK